ncbi:two-component system C4-dicarboxylate transport sensor histidine kinase DctB [Sphingomonas sp. BE123]|uniref:sensor histidine kinase n=1 Tax=Sphingomonas sp. BE123 TaxID=2817842 RepID=UPI00285ED5DD|nr:ATP-binding protein [Sphingomonas sp. BE123]MDR6850574.1 two-component system C4-dicarboxylate transport sensor histidine kinase DctB [Sphingomonas sp. BE123]
MALVAVIGLVLVGAVALGAARWARGQAVAATDAAAAELARANAGLLTSELQKFRLLPLVLTEYPDVPALLDAPSATVAARVNARLELLARRTDAAAIYVIDARGRTVAASNHRLPTSFVGQNYGFRPYFRDALRDGSAELFALGTISGVPGLYLAQRIGTLARPLGVVVVKIEFERVQSAWAAQQGTTIVTDRHGVVIVTGRPDWRFRAVAPLSAESRRAIRSSRQYGTLPLSPLPLTIAGADVRQADPDAAGRVASVAAPLAGARLHVLMPLRPALASANANARLVTLAALALIVGALVLVWRARERQQLQAAARAALEAQVAERTAELRETNKQLEAESAERARADQRYRAAREELAQASRLGSLGQITAGVAHEINQPVAAIRTFADNARQLLDRGETARATDNLGRISALTERIGTITAELRNFARKRTPEIGAVEIGSALDSVMLLIGDRVRAAGVAFERRGDLTVRVIADRVRLEQVLINLVQNALDALGSTEAPRVILAVEAAAERARITVTDNGPGVPPDLRDQLFTPFVTGREAGLGLGLAISRDIARDFGGELILVQTGEGAQFELTLLRA